MEIGEQRQGDIIVLGPFACARPHIAKRILSAAGDDFDAARIAAVSAAGRKR